MQCYCYCFRPASTQASTFVFVTRWRSGGGRRWTGGWGEAKGITVGRCPKATSQEKQTAHKDCYSCSETGEGVILFDIIIGWLSEAGLLEWMCFVIFHARSCERSQRTSRPISEYVLLHGVYNSGSWTWNREAVQMPILLQLQKLPWKDDGGWKKSVCVIFWLTRRLRVRRKNAFCGIL